MGDNDSSIGWVTLTKNSFSVIQANPKLLVFPVLSGLAWLVFLGGLAGAVLEFGLLTVEGLPVIGVLGICVYLGSMVVSTFFAAGLVHETRDALRDGSKPSLRTGLAAAWHAKVSVLVWSVISTAFKVILSILESSGAITRHAENRRQRSWAVKTLFIAPVMVFERPGVREMFSRSSDTLSKMQDKTSISIRGIGWIGLYFAFPFIILGLLVVLANVFVGFTTMLGGLAAGLVTILLGVVISFLLGQTLQGIIKTALYLYATEDVRLDGFENVDQSAGSESERWTD